MFSLCFTLATGLSVLLIFVSFSLCYFPIFSLIDFCSSFYYFLPCISFVLICSAFSGLLRWECRVLFEPCSLFWCEHFNAINMFSFFFSPVFDVRFVFIHFSVFLKFCSFLAHDLFKSILLNVEVLGCFYVALLLLICCLIPLWLENIITFSAFEVVDVCFLTQELSRNCPVLRTSPRYLERNVYCVDKGCVAYECQILLVDGVGFSIFSLYVCMFFYILCIS